MQIKACLKRFATLLLALTLVISVAACGSKPASTDGSKSVSDNATVHAQKTEAPKEKIKIRFYNLWPKNDDDPGSRSYYKMYAIFKKAHPEVDLELMEDAHEAWATKIKTMMTANDLPEVYVSQPSDFSVFADSGVYYDLTDSVNEDKEWKDSFIAGALNTLAIDGRVYGIPISSYVEGVFYNDELFNKFNLAYPQNYEDLKNVVKVFAENGIAAFAVGAKDGWPVTMTTHFLMDREAGFQYFEDSKTQKENTFDNPMYINAFSKYLELAKMGAFPKGVAGASFDDSKMLFAQGKAAMMIDGNWDIGWFDQQDNGNFGKKVKFANFPAIEGGKGVQDAICVGFGKSLCISQIADEDQKKAGIELIKTLTNKDAAKIYLEEGGFTCGTKVENPDNSKVSPLMVQVNEVVSKSSQTWAAYGECITPGFYDEMNKIGQLVILNSITAEEAAKKMEKARLEFQLTKN